LIEARFVFHGPDSSRRLQQEKRDRNVGNFRVADITGQFLPVLMASRMMDVLWSDLHITTRADLQRAAILFMTFPHRLNSKDLSRKRRSFLMKNNPTGKE
jgi:hypothetical protein